ncbi:MAG: 2-C-methyl-D-erythritol 4-phosphate cytidylyltransferase [Chitinivibrionales bacterium]|nr:2-C-methyl-D-erythritol 4-phosphate cytidylyltransferase [Chitinivibrionales bacterium]
MLHRNEETNSSIPCCERSVSAVIVAGGSGTRLGAPMPKAFVLMNGRPLYTYALQIFSNHERVSDIVVVVPADYVEPIKNECSTLMIQKPVSVVAGGSQRWESVRNGVVETQQDSKWVMVHDAARPFVSPETISALANKQGEFRCAIAAMMVTDTMRRFCGDRCTETIDRSTLLRVATPQLFHKPTLSEAFIYAQTMATPPTDEAMLMQHHGVPIGFVWCDQKNFKITTQTDLEIAELLSRGA